MIAMKPTLLLACLLICSFACLCQQKVSGTITYYYNQYQGNKADVGASVFIIDSSNAGNLFNPIDSFCKGYTHYQFLKVYKTLQEQAAASMDGPGMWMVSKKAKKRYIQSDSIPQYVLDGAKQAGVETKDKFHYLDSLCFRAIIAFEASPFTYKTQADGVGNYSINLKSPGTYYVLLKSANRTGDGLSFVTSKYYISKCSIKNEDINFPNINKNFDLY